MNHTAYMIISSACLCVSYLLFVLLRKEIMFMQQRIFLIVSVILSMSLPFTHFSIPLRESLTPVTTSRIITSGTGANSAKATPDFIGIPELIFKIYCAVALLFTLVIIFQILRIAWLYITAEKSAEKKITILRSDKIKTPFSFFRWIFIPSTLQDDQETGSICIHESIHAKQLHSLDNLIFGIVCAVMWFNPVIWLMKKSAHLIHEYLADDGTLKRGIEKSRYQALLLNQASEIELISIPSGFNKNLLKKRMIMMTKSNTKETQKVNVLSIIPLPLILVMTVALLRGLFPSELNAQKQETKKDSLKEVVVVGYGSRNQSTQNTGNDTINYIVDGVRVNDVKDLNPDSIESVNVLKEDRTVIIRTKNFAAKNKGGETLKLRSVNGDLGRILYIIDDKRISKEEFDKFPVENIENINVRKDETSRGRYGAMDYDGVIIITSKKKR